MGVGLSDTDITPARQGQGFWLADFAWENGALVIVKTGIRLAVTRALINEIAHWAVYLVILFVTATGARLTGQPRLSLWFAPDRPRPWYLVRGAAIWGGLHLAKTPAEAHGAIYFDDTTTGTPPDDALLNPQARRFNFACTDIRKSHVAAVFEAVFGYPLTVDPLTATGEIVEKPEKNGVHGGRIVTAPLPPRSGYTYQRVVDTRDAANCCQDLRTPCANGRPVVVWIKTKTPEGRFSINNRKAQLADPETVFSAAEREQIRRFTAQIGLDWGGLDILRDRQDGRIYIVDVNKTDLGPVIALSWLDKIRSMRCLSAALRDMVTAPASAPAFTPSLPAHGALPTYTLSDCP